MGCHKTLQQDLCLLIFMSALLKKSCSEQQRYDTYRETVIYYLRCKKIETSERHI